MNDETLLLRQIDPRHYQDGHVSSLAFRPLPDKDENKLSVYDGDLINPPASFEHFTVERKCRSVGVRSLKVVECTRIGLSCRPDPEEFPEHAVVDFNNLGVAQQRKHSAKLSDLADARGWLYFKDPEASVGTGG